MAETLGEEIKHYRKLKKYSQETLAEKAELSKMSIRRYESGERQPGIEQLRKIADALEVDPFALYSFDMATEALEKNINKKENELLDNYRKLNTTGKEKAAERVEELTEIPRYTNPDEPQEQ